MGWIDPVYFKRLNVLLYLKIISTQIIADSTIIIILFVNAPEFGDEAWLASRFSQVEFVDFALASVEFVLVNVEFVLVLVEIVLFLFKLSINSTLR